MKGTSAYAAIVILLLTLSSCAGEGGDSGASTLAKTQENNSPKGAIVNVDGQLFSIPSPIQTAMFIQKNGSGYNSSLVAPVELAKDMTTSNRKAMAMGMYGADLGYISIFGDQDKALPYMGAIRRLSEEMDIQAAFDETLIERFGDNIGVTDSMLVLISELYESGDAYLKNNKRYDIAAMVLLGGWIEGLHFSCSEAANGSEAMRRRVAEQKTSLERLIKMLAPHDSSPSIDQLLADLNSLKADYEKINSTYTYRKPEVNAGEQTTTLKGKVIHQMNASTLTAISEKIAKMRNDLIGSK